MEQTSENSMSTNQVLGEKPRKPCLGYRLPVPSHLRPSTSYPWTLWTIEDHPWEARSLPDAIALTAQNCDRELDPDLNESSCCPTCSALAHSEAAQGILHRMESGVEEGSKLEYYGYNDVLERLRQGHEQLVKLGIAKPKPIVDQEPSDPERVAMVSRLSDEEIAMGIMVAQNSIREQDNLLRAFLDLQAADAALVQASQRLEQLVQSIAPGEADEPRSLLQDADSSDDMQRQASDDNEVDQVPKIDRKGKGKARAPPRTILDDILDMPGMGMGTSPLMHMMSSSMFAQERNPGGGSAHLPGPCKEHGGPAGPAESDPDNILRMLGLDKTPKQRAKALSPLGDPDPFIEQMNNDLEHMMSVQKAIDEELGHRLSLAKLRSDGQSPEVGDQPQELSEEEDANQLRELQRKSTEMQESIRQLQARSKAPLPHRPTRGMNSLLAAILERGPMMQMQGSSEGIDDKLRLQPSTSGLREVERESHHHGMGMEVDSKGGL